MEDPFDTPRPSFTSAGTEVEQRSESADREQINGGPSPEHPIPQLQGPFEESIYEALHGAENEWIVDLDAQMRRGDLLQKPQYERLCGRKWRQRAGERYHPFWKLIAQMSFGLHLLVKGTAKSDAAVLRILQAHVDEIDGFISRTEEDFLIIQIDLRTRIQYLSLPLENLDVFDEMLEDRNFRLAMIDYNDKLELAIERFTAATNDALRDIQKGKEAIGGLWQYLKRSAKENAPLSSSTIAIYNSMLANTEGWNSAFSKLRRKGTALHYAISQLGRAVTEMQRRVGVASRKDVPAVPISRAKSFRGLYDRGMSVYISSPSAFEKPLPGDPAPVKASRSRPPPKLSGTGKLARQKSVPNLRTMKEFEECRVDDKAPSRAISVNGASSRGSESGSILPRISKTIIRRLSKAKPTTKVTKEGLVEEIPSRPSTATSRTLKSFRKSRHGHQQQQNQKEHSQERPPPDPAKRPGTSHTSAQGETMKDQLLQYFKSDRVLNTWESITEKEKKERRPFSKKDSLMSRFHAKSSSLQSDGLQTDLLQDDLQKQMAWLDEETKALNTYTLNPKHEATPRLHLISDHMSSQQQLDEKESRFYNAGHLKSLETDAQSIITALPPFPRE